MMILNPFKLDDASEVYELGENLSLSKEEMKRALQLFAELREKANLERFSDERFLSMVSLLSKIPIDETYSVIIAPRKSKIVATHPTPELVEGIEAKPILHTSRKFVLSYQTVLYY